MSDDDYYNDGGGDDMPVLTVPFIRTDCYTEGKAKESNIHYLVARDKTEARIKIWVKNVFLCSPVQGIQVVGRYLKLLMSPFAFFLGFTHTL